MAISPLLSRVCSTVQISDDWLTDMIAGSFKNPPPGQPVTAPFDKERLQLGSKADDLHDEVARKNFRLVVIVPDVVEQTDLSDPEKARRFRYTWDGETARHNAGWRTEELWP